MPAFGSPTKPKRSTVGRVAVPRRLLDVVIEERSSEGGGAIPPFLAGLDADDALDRARAGLDTARYYLDRGFAPAAKARAFQKALDVVAALPTGELEARVASGTLQELDGIGTSTGAVIADAVDRRASSYLSELAASTEQDVGAGSALRSAVRGDLHSHTLWSDGAESVRTMAESALALGHEYLAVTDHSARLTVAHGLDEARLTRQLAEIEQLNAELAPFRILTGMEVDILGHCTGRKSTSRGRPPSRFDAEIVFAACVRFDTAVEVNCRPERQDPPEELLALALQWGCRVSIDTDAHAPGQLEWQAWGCGFATDMGVEPGRIGNTYPLDELLAWTDAHPRA